MGSLYWGKGERADLGAATVRSQAKATCNGKKRRCKRKAPRAEIEALCLGCSCNINHLRVHDSEGQIESEKSDRLMVSLRSVSMLDYPGKKADERLQYMRAELR